jgi:hypothetical protein
VTAARIPRLLLVVATYATSTRAFADDPQRPSADPTKPSADPAKPSADPTKPSADPTKPSGDPTTPSGAPTPTSGTPTTTSGTPTTTSGTPTTTSGAPTSTSGAPTPPTTTSTPSTATSKSATSTTTSEPAAVAAKTNDDDEGTPKLSLPTEADREAWQRSGFRLGLGLLYGDMVGLRGAPSGRLLGPWVRFGLRLDPDWSVLASFQYVSASKSGGLSGLRFAGTLEPTWHATRNLSLALGFGFGGIVEGRTGRPDVDPLPSTLDTSYTFPDARMPIPSCSGVGAAGVARAEWAWVLGPRSSTSISLEALGQWTGCVQNTNRVEPDTGQPIVRRQWWPHTGATLSWGITWR